MNLIFFLKRQLPIVKTTHSYYVYFIANVSIEGKGDENIKDDILCIQLYDLMLNIDKCLGKN